jgi:hypothetical protein
LDGYGYDTVDKLDGLPDYVSWTHQFEFPSAVDAITSGVLSIDLSDDQDSGIEIAFGYAENGEWDFGLVSTQSYTYDIEVSSLADGLFSVTLPEPSTLSLLGAGLLGVSPRPAKN